MNNDFLILNEKLNGRKLVIYGMGLIGHEALMLFEKSGGLNVEFFVDRRANLNSNIFGKPVYSKETLSPQKHYCVISPPNFYSQISQELKDLGFLEDRDYCSYTSLRSEDIVYEGVSIGKHTNGFLAFSDSLGYGTKDYIKSIGRFCSINKSAAIGADHNFFLSTSHEIFHLNGSKKYSNIDTSEKKITIGNDVWIGAGVFINSSKVKYIGDGAIIAAGSIVISDVPPYSIVAGVPATVKKYRFSENEINTLLSIKWWNWPDEKIKENIEIFINYKLFFDKYSERKDV